MLGRGGVGAHQQHLHAGALRKAGPHFCPFTTKESPSSTARVCRLARSEPAPGSE